MQHTRKKVGRRIVTGILLYCILNAFLWSFFVVSARSHNRLSHCSAAVAQLSIASDKTISLHLAEKTMTLQSPALDQIDAAAFHFAGSTLQMTYLVWDILDFKA